MIRLLSLALGLFLLALPAPSGAAPELTPRLGIDYEILPVPQPTYGKGKIEVAEVFSYGCHFCAEFQPAVDKWTKTTPASVRWEYVPAVFGGHWDNFARAYFAAEILGVRKRTHNAVFKTIFVDKQIRTGSEEEIADMYAKLGVDRTRFLDTMRSAAVTARLGRAKQFALRTGISGTPTLILNGKYRIGVTTDRGYAGTIATLNFLLASGKTTKPEPTSK